MFYGITAEWRCPERVNTLISAAAGQRGLRSCVPGHPEGHALPYSPWSGASFRAAPAAE